MSAVDDLRRRFETLAALIEAEATARHGFGHFRLAAHVDTESRTLDLRGSALQPSAWRRVASRFRARIPAGWRLRVRITPLIGSFVRPRRAVPLFAASRGPALATGWSLGDAALSLLGTSEDGARALVRAVDGTLAWLDAEEPLNAAITPRCAPARTLDGEALDALARRWVGTPYRLGGVDSEGIDCSALTQRMLATTTGITLPRHSGDQLSLGRTGPQTNLAALRSGDLAFIWSPRERVGHVGLVLASEGGREHAQVLHASTSRARVVLDPLERFLSGASQVSAVRFTELRRWYDAQVGHSHVAWTPRCVEEVVSPSPLPEFGGWSGTTNHVPWATPVTFLASERDHFVRVTH